MRKKHLISINGKKKLKRILIEGEKFKLRKLPSKDFIALFSSRRRACPALKHNRVSEVFKGFKVHDFEYMYYVKEITFCIGNFIYVIRSVSFTFDFKKILENALRFVADGCSLEYFAMLSRFHSRGRTHDAGSVTRIAFKYKPTGFRINFFKNDFPDHYFVFVYS